MKTVEYKDVMLDLETLGLAPGCVVLSIGAVAFNYDGKIPTCADTGPEYHRIIRTGSSLTAGLDIDENTMAWWSKQSPEARKTLDAAMKLRGRGTKDLMPTCVEFNQWIRQFGTKVRVWGNGANFDQPILREIFHKACVAPAWSPFEERCYRTLKNLVPGPKLERIGTYHNALDDAISQAHHAVVLLRILHGQGKA